MNNFTLMYSIIICLHSTPFQHLLLINMWFYLLQVSIAEPCAQILETQPDIDLDMHTNPVVNIIYQTSLMHIPPGYLTLHEVNHIHLTRSRSQ